VIAVRIDPDKKDKGKPVRDDYTRLGEYIAAAKEKGEKLDKLWIVNCGAGGELADLKTALIEIEAKRFMKPKVKNKTYHLMVSFRPGEREKLSADDLKDIERNFADALGYTEHQRVVGTHVNTDNFHMHVAYNKIHPVTLRCLTPEKDFFALERVCRAMEKKYGLFVDKGLSDTKEHDKAAQKARRFERQTWQQSFEGHLQEHKAEILASIGGGKTWRQVHEGLAEFDAGLKKRGAGLVFHHLADPRRTMKASSLDRSCSLAALEKRLGPFEPAKEKAKGEECRPRAPKRPYTAKPLFYHPGQDQLWRLYQTGTRRPGFLSRNLHIRNWKSYLLADAHKDALALATILFYKELLRTLEGAPVPSHAPKAIQPALQSWFSSLPWLPPVNALEQPGHLPGVGLKADEAGRVLFPMRDDSGRIWAVRAVDEQGRTCDIGDMAVRPKLSHVIDPKGLLSNAGGPYHGPLILTADCAAATKLHKVTGAPVVIAAREKDLPELAKGLRADQPKAFIVVAAPERSRPAKRAAQVAAARLLTVTTALAISPDLADQVKRATPEMPVKNGQARPPDHPPSREQERNIEP
jgi:hypothetical protein